MVSSLPFTLFCLPWVQIIIKNFLKFLVEVGRTSLKYVLMLGKKKFRWTLLHPHRERE